MARSGLRWNAVVVGKMRGQALLRAWSKETLVRLARLAQLIVLLVVALVAGPLALVAGSASAETTPVVIDSYDGANSGVGFGTRNITTGGGVTYTFAGGAATFTLPYAQGAGATLTYTSATPVDLTAGSADRLRIAFDSVTSNDPSAAAVQIYVTATDSAGKTRLATLTGIGPSATAGQVVYLYGQNPGDFAGDGDLTKVVSIALTVQPGSNAGGYQSTIALSSFSTLNPNGVPGPTTTPQTITFPQPASPAAIGGSASLTATASSGLPVSYGVSTPALCHVSGSTVFYDHAGTCRITADQAGNATYDPAPQVTRDVSVAKTAQTITFTSTAPTAASVGGTYTATATSSSGLPVSFSSAGSNPANACTVSTAGAVSFQHPGTCVVTATQNGDADRSAAPAATQSIPVGKGSQTVTFTSTKPDPAAIGGSYTAVATASSGQPVTYGVGASSPANACTVSSSGTVSFQHAGTCVVTANQAGTADLDPATASQPITVAKTAQTVTFTSTRPDPAAIGGNYTAVATASSGQPVTYGVGASSPANACTMSSSGTVSFQHAGTCVVTADQAGTADTAAAPTASQSITVARAAQAITFTSAPPSPAYVGSTYAVTASGGGGTAPVTFGSTTPATCSVASSAAGATVTFLAAGSCTIQADQAADADHSAAAPSTQTVPVTKVPATVSVTTNPAQPVYGQSVTATAVITPATGAASGTVQFSVDGAPVGAPVTVSGGRATSVDLAPLDVGNRTVGAAFTPSDTTTYANATGSTQLPVASAMTTTTVTVQPAALVAAVAAVAPGVGTPSGTVTFRVDGNVVGSADLVNGTARMPYVVPAGSSRAVSATYAGDARFTGSSASTARVDPTIVATVTGQPAASKAGWYRGSVTVTFTCTAPGAPLTSACPAPVVLDTDGAGQSVSRTVTTTDGGSATAVASGIDIDSTAPKVRFMGLRPGASYVGTAPSAPRCRATDALSGVNTCRVTKTTRHTAGGTRLRYVAIANDQAGNRARTAVAVTVADLGIVGVPVRDGVYQTRVGHGYTLVVLGSAPRYRYATPVPGAPHGGDVPLKRAGSVGGVKRWTIGISITAAMRHHAYWNLGVVQNGHLRTIRIRVR